MMKSCTPLLCQWLIEWLCRQLTWMDLLGCRRREKREKRRKTISSVVPSLSRYPPHISLPEQSKGRYMRQYECSKDLHHDIKRGRRGDKRGGGGEKVKEEMTHLRRYGSVSQRAPPSTSHLRCALIIYLHSKEEKIKVRRGEKKIINIKKQKTTTTI